MTVALAMPDEQPTRPLRPVHLLARRGIVVPADTALAEFRAKYVRGERAESAARHVADFMGLPGVVACFGPPAVEDEPEPERTEADFELYRLELAQRATPASAEIITAIALQVPRWGLGDRLVWTLRCWLDRVRRHRVHGGSWPRSTLVRSRGSDDRRVRPRSRRSFWRRRARLLGWALFVVADMAAMQLALTALRSV